MLKILIRHLQEKKNTLNETTETTTPAGNKHYREKERERETDKEHTNGQINDEKKKYNMNILYIV